MLYLIALLVALFDIAISAHLTVWGGQNYIISALILLSAAYGEWRSWLIWSIALGIVSFFHTLALPGIILLLIFSVVSFLIFRRWIDEDNVLMSRSVAVGIVALFILVSLYSSTKQVSLALLASLMLTTPALLLWYRFYNSKRSSLI